jgi:hypothetical protein
MYYPGTSPARAQEYKRYFCTIYRWLDYALNALNTLVSVHVLCSNRDHGYGRQTPMGDEDEYDNAFSDIEIDDSVAAILEQEEKKYAATQHIHPPPPPKKQKLNHRQPSEDDLSQVPIVFGLDGDYFTRVNATPAPREASRPTPPQQAKQHATASAALTNAARRSYSPFETAQPRAQSFLPVTVQQTPSSHTTNQVSGSTFNAYQHVGSPAQTIQDEALQGQTTRSHETTSLNLGAGSSAALSKPPSTRRPDKYTPAGQIQQKQGVPGPPSRQSPAPTASTYASAASWAPRPDTPYQNTFEAAGRQERTPEFQRQNSLKRPHSENGFGVQQQAPAPSQVRSGDGKVQLELSILKAQLDEVRVCRVAQCWPS